MAAEMEQLKALIRSQISELRADLMQSLDQADKDPGGFIMSSMEARIKALEDEGDELSDPDAVEQPDPIFPFYGSEEGDAEDIPDAFGVSLVGSSVTVLTGRYTEHGGASGDVGETVITLTGGPYEYIFVRWDRSYKTATVNHAATRPLSAGNEVFVTLATYRQTGTGTYELELVNHRGDINFDLPLS